jgi:hypothetical protein
VDAWQRMSTAVSHVLGVLPTGAVLRTPKTV